MKLFIYFGIMLTIILFANCSEKTNQDNSLIIFNDIANVVKKDNYIVDTNISSTNYSNYEGYFPEEGFASTREIAVQIAESVLNEIYEKENIDKQKPFLINLENGIWLIEGQIEKGIKGGVVYIEIKKSNGEILKVIHGK